MREVLPGTMESSWERERLLEALDAYRRGLSDAPLLRKWNGGGLGMALQPVPGEWMGGAAGGGMGVAGQSVPGEGMGGAGGGRVDMDGKEAGGVGAMTFVISSEEVDRHGDVVSAAGWQLAAYRQNPVFLWAHDYTRPVIGRAAAVWPEPGLLLARMEFAPTDFAAEVAALYRSGYQQGVSVGFKPLRYAERRQESTGAFLGIRFLEQELLEVSAVPVPANRQALRRAMAQSPRLGDYLCRAGGLGLDPEVAEGISPGLAAVLAEVRAGL